MRLIQGDCLEEMKKMEDKSIDCIVIDPPYFLPAVHYNTRKWQLRNFADLNFLEHFFKDVFKEFRRILKETGVMYIFCNGQSYPLFWFYLFPFCKSVRPLIWDKKTSINGYSWRHQHELIIFAEMPKARKVPSGDGDILRYSAVKVKERKHPAEKPVDLLKTLIEKSTLKEEVVLDCFMGSGSTGVACNYLERDFIGIELSEDYFKIAKERLNVQPKN